MEHTRVARTVLTISVTNSAVIPGRVASKSAKEPYAVTVMPRTESMKTMRSFKIAMMLRNETNSEKAAEIGRREEGQRREKMKLQDCRHHEKNRVFKCSATIPAPSNQCTRGGERHRESMRPCAARVDVHVVRALVLPASIFAACFSPNLSLTTP